MSGECHKNRLWLDPRTKLFLILLCVLSSMFAPSLAYQFVLVMLIAILGAFFGKWKYVIKAVCFYAIICALTVWIMAEMTGTLRTMFIAFLGLFHKVYACGTLAGIVLTTTKVNEFLSAMNRVHAPKKLVIPMAVMLRYLPTIVLLSKTQWTLRYHLYGVSSNFKIILSFCFVRCQDVSFLLWSNCGQPTLTNDHSPLLSYMAQFRFSKIEIALFCLHELFIRRICQPCQ